MKVQKKYKTEIGESMEKPGNKLKKLLIIMGTTGAVYAGFKYLLPLVVPFFAAYGLALLLKPSSHWLSRHVRIRFRKKTRYLPVGVAGGLEFFLLLSAAVFFIYLGAQKLCEELTLLADRLPVWIQRLDRWLTGGCIWVERTFRLKNGCVIALVRDMLMGLSDAARRATMPFLMANSVTMIRWLIGGIIILVVVFLGTVLSLQEMEAIKQRRERSIFSKEFELFSSRILLTGKAYLKSQGTILLLTTTLCIAGMLLIGNPYYIMAGIAIGLLDALPIFGTGTVLIPWSIILVFSGHWWKAACLFGLYLVCYFLREIMEARLMGNEMGLSPLETLASIYVGLQLFGFFGFILGPVGLLLIEDMVEAWTKPD